MNDIFFNTFAGLDSMSTDDKRALLSHSATKKLVKGQLMVGDYKRCGGIPFVLSGSIRLFRVSENGRDLTLYKIHAGEVCVLAAICAYASLQYDFTAEALEDSELFVLPAESFNSLVQKSSVFRGFVFSGMADKLIMALNTIEFLKFPSIEEKIKSYLYEFAGTDMTVRVTHEAIAKDIGSSREVVSRKLKELEESGCLELSRGKIKIIKNN